MTGQPTIIGGFEVYAKREGIMGEYCGYVCDQSKSSEQCVYTTRRYCGPGAKDRAFQAARRHALTLTKAPNERS